jgi:hypothetical protein
MAQPTPGRCRMVVGTILGPEDGSRTVPNPSLGLPCVRAIERPASPKFLGGLSDHVRGAQTPGRQGYCVYVRDTPLRELLMVKVPFGMANTLRK